MENRKKREEQERRKEERKRETQQRQMDANECLIALLALIRDKAATKLRFESNISTVVKCTTCEHESMTQNKILMLSLELKFRLFY